MNSAKIVVFGATGYTGRLVVQELVRSGVRPVLAGRNFALLESVSRQFDGLDIQLADAHDLASCKGLVARRDILISTVGPFGKHGRYPLAAAVANGAHYLDSTGEAPFIRNVFEGWHQAATKNGSLLLTAFGYDWIPGNIAGALAMRQAGSSATQLEIGYFLTRKSSPNAMSSGTRASVADVFLGPSFTWEGKKLIQQQPAAKIQRFDFPENGSSQKAFSIGGTEQLSLPAIFPQLDTVNVYLGWFGPLTLPIMLLARAIEPFALRSKSRGWIEEVLSLGAYTTGQGPTKQQRQKTGSLVTAIARDTDGNPLATVTLHGENGYDITARCLAWGAVAVRDQRFSAEGARGPVEAFGIDQLEAALPAFGFQLPSFS